MRARGHLGDQGCGSVVIKLVVVRQGPEQGRDIEAETEHDGEVGARSRAERGHSRSADVTKAGRGEGNDEGVLGTATVAGTDEAKTAAKGHGAWQAWQNVTGEQGPYGRAGKVWACARTRTPSVLGPRW